MKKYLFIIPFSLLLFSCDKEKKKPGDKETIIPAKADGDYQVAVYHSWYGHHYMGGDSVLTIDSTARDTGWVNISTMEDTVYISLLSDLDTIKDRLVRSWVSDDSVQYSSISRSDMYYLVPKNKIVYRRVATMSVNFQEYVGFEELE